MQLKFSITETIETEIFYGYYAVYILGGHYVKTNPGFLIQVENIETLEKIELTEKTFKVRDFKFGRKAVRFYSFQINEYDKFRISVNNYQDIIVKDSMLEIFPLPFSIPHILLSFLLGRSRKEKNINSIEILIE